LDGVYRYHNSEKAINLAILDGFLDEDLKKRLTRLDVVDVGSENEYNGLKAIANSALSTKRSHERLSSLKFENEVCLYAISALGFLI